MPMCIMKGCTNRSAMKNSKQEELEKKMKITFHAFPKCPVRRKLWVNSLGLENSVLPKYPTICSVHFRHEDLDKTSLVYVRLRENAIPHLKFPEVIKEENINACEEISTEKPSFAMSSAVIKVETDDSIEFTEPMKIATGKRKPDVNTDLHEISEKVSKIKSESRNEHFGTLLQTSDKSTQVEVSVVDKYTCIHPRRLFHSPRKEMLREYVYIAKMKRKYQLYLKVLKQKNRRKQRKITNLQTILQTLKKKNLLQEEQLQSLSGISDFNNEQFQRMRKKSSNQRVARSYSPELRLFSLTLHYYSPRAYCYVREKFGLCLPHPKTLYKWYRSVNGEPGFNDEAIRYIKAYSDSIEERLFVTLIIDEVVLRQHIEFDGQKFIGHVDVGKAFACDEETIAKEALVFLLVGLNKPWKIPVGYFLIDSINAEQKANLVKQCLRTLHHTGVRVVGLTCNGASSNMGMSKALGCNFSNLESLQTSFSHPVTRESIYLILDPSHMVKLICYTLGDFKCFFNKNKEKVEWKYIENLYILQEKERLHLTNKLRKQHVQYDNKEMKVKYAEQVLSSSVSKAICMCRTDLKLEEFKNSQATEEFLHEINDLFDIFNSRNLRQKYFKQPVNCDNYKSIINKLQHCEEYIKNLTLESGQKIVESIRKTGFLGFLICIQTLKDLYKDICETKQVSYIPWYQCSLDHVEIFFSCIRSLGGSNNDPTVRQFKTAFKKLLIHNEIKTSDSGNCIPLYNIPILHYCAESSEKLINSSVTHTTVDVYVNTKNLTKEYEKLEEMNNVVLELHCYALTTSQNSFLYTEFIDRIVVYIAGWVSRKLSLTLNCSICISSLQSSEENDTVYKLIAIKSRGGLVHPSFDVITICRKAEKIVRFYVILNKMPPVSQICNTILQEINVQILFVNLIEHSNDQVSLYDHRIHLIKCIINYYIKVRFNYICKEKNNAANSKRRYFNKRVLFSGH